MIKYKKAILSTLAAIAFVSMGASATNNNQVIPNKQDKTLIKETKEMRQSYDLAQEYKQSAESSEFRVRKNRILTRESFEEKDQIALQNAKQKRIDDTKKAEEAKKQAELKKQQEENKVSMTNVSVSSSNTTNYGNDLQNYVLTKMEKATGIPAETWNYIITRESRWQIDAQNDHSTAHGLFQSLWVNFSNDVDTQIADAIRLVNADRAAGGDGLRPWALTAPK